ncbi:MAG: DNA polymerase III subunit delta, partial [Thermodesulfobacteriota bacterium]
ETIFDEFFSSKDMRWVETLVDYCKENELKIPEHESDGKVLEEAVQKGFPGENRLVITAESVDKRISLYKAVSKNGWVVDCSVPAGERQAEKIAREKICQEEMASILKGAGKQMEMEASAALVEMTGFDLKRLDQNLNILIQYTGDRKRITRKDVEDVISRTKQDPVYALTHSISEKDASGALFYLDSLLRNDFHPVQILSAVANQIRKLMVVKDFVQSEYGKSWRTGSHFSYFREQVVPALLDFDTRLVESMMEGVWKKSAEGLKILKNPGNVYPVYMLLKASDRFHELDLLNAFEELREADRLLKTSSRNPRFILERLILGVCGKEGS